MCLLYQMSLGDESFFAPYLRTLPYPVTLRDWSSEELAEVDPYVPRYKHAVCHLAQGTWTGQRHGWSHLPTYTLVVAGSRMPPPPLAPDPSWLCIINTKSSPTRST